MSEDKRHSDWQGQEGKCNREKKGLGRCFFVPKMAIRSLKTAQGSERGGQIRTSGLPGCGFGSIND